jgi:hypothetical protein
MATSGLWVATALAVMTMPSKQWLAWRARGRANFKLRAQALLIAREPERARRPEPCGGGGGGVGARPAPAARG